MSDGLCGCTPNSSDDCEFGQLQEQLATITAENERLRGEVASLTDKHESVEREYQNAVSAGINVTIPRLEAEVEALKADNGVLTGDCALLTRQKADLQRQLAAAREAIEKAPHTHLCSIHDRPHPCDCWKSAALAQIEAGGGK